MLCQIFIRLGAAVCPSHYEAGSDDHADTVPTLIVLPSSARMLLQPGSHTLAIFSNEYLRSTVVVPCSMVLRARRVTDLGITRCWHLRAFILGTEMPSPARYGYLYDGTCGGCQAQIDD